MSTGPTADVEWNAGDLGCGDLVLQLMLRMKAMAPGQVLRLTAFDPGAPADIPAWCRMTGHTLLEEHPPTYLIRRKPKET
jgi:tRNA 2-thiouridine synthesizing protein A